MGSGTASDDGADARPGQPTAGDAGRDAPGATGRNAPRDTDRDAPRDTADRDAHDGVDRVRGVRIRLARPADRALLDRLNSAEIAGEFNYFDDPPSERLRGGLLASRHFIAELANGTAFADLTCFGVPYGPNRRSVAWRIGITVLPEFRNRGLGAAAQRLLAEHLFATTGSGRVEADTDVANVAEQRALERAGFEREGVMRQAQWRGGAWHDTLLYSRTRDPR